MANMVYQNQEHTEFSIQQWKNSLLIPFADKFSDSEEESHPWTTLSFPTYFETYAAPLLHHLTTPFEFQIGTRNDDQDDRLQRCWNLLTLDNLMDCMHINSASQTQDLLNVESVYCQARCLHQAGFYKKALSLIFDKINFNDYYDEEKAALCSVLASCYEAIGVTSEAADPYHWIFTNLQQNLTHILKDNGLSPSQVLALDKLIGRRNVLSSNALRIFHSIQWREEDKYIGHLLMGRLFDKNPFSLDESFSNYSCVLQLVDAKILDTYQIEKYLQSTYPGCSILDRLSTSIVAVRTVASRLMSKYDFENALALFNYILEFDPYDPDVLIMRSICLMQNEQYYDELFDMAMQLHIVLPQTAVTWFVDGCACMVRKWHLGAIFSFRKAVNNNFKLYEACIGAGHAHSYRDNSDSAILCYHNAARISPRYYRPFLYLGMEEMKEIGKHSDFISVNKKLNRAEDYLTHAIELEQSDPYVYNELGVLESNRKLYDKAIEWFYKAVNYSEKINVADSIFYVNLGYAQVKNVEAEKAQQSFAKAIKINRFDFNAWLGLGISTYLLGNADCILHFNMVLRYTDCPKSLNLRNAATMELQYLNLEPFSNAMCEFNFVDIIAITPNCNAVSAIQESNEIRLNKILVAAEESLRCF